jgi:hypothetical protein
MDMDKAMDLDTDTEIDMDIPVDIYYYWTGELGRLYPLISLQQNAAICVRY